MKTRVFVTLLDSSKLKVLEKLGSFLKSYKHFRLVPKEVWGYLVTIKFEYSPVIKDLKSQTSKEEQKIERLKELKEKNKLSKRKLQELKELEKAEAQKIEKKKAKVEDKRIQKIIKKELKESEAIIDFKTKQRIGKQILLKLFYIAFKLVREYFREASFEAAVQTLLKHLSLADSHFVADVMEELQQAYNEINKLEQNKDASIVKRQIIIIDAIFEISHRYS